MANFDSTEVVRSLAPNEISKMTNPQLKRAITTLLNAERDEEPSNSVLLNELRSLRDEVKELGNLKDEVKRLSQFRWRI